MTTLYYQGLKLRVAFIAARATAGGRRDRGDGCTYPPDPPPRSAAVTDTDDEKGLSYDGHHRRRALDLGAGRDRQLFFDRQGR